MADALADVVIMVPGFTGSNLYYTWNPFGLNLLWPNPAKLVAGGFQKMRIPVAGESGGNPDSLRLGLGGPIMPYYGNLVTYLRYRGWTCSNGLHDFRVPVAEDGARLAQIVRLSSQLGGFSPGKCSIVCHSRGGLVTRYALGLLAATGELARVRRVVGLGVPHQGALNAVYNLGGPYSFAEKLHHFSMWASAHSFGLLSLGDVQATLRSWQGVYELMPDPLRNSLTAGVGPQLYVSANWAAVPQPPVASYLAAAAAAWSALSAPPADVEWIDVVGYGLSTAVNTPSAANAIGRELDEYSLAGDGTVAEWSAHQSPRRQLRTPTKHDMLPLDSRLWPYVHELLAVGLASDVTLGGDVLNTP